MQRGKQVPFSAISTSNSESITVRGKDLCDELIGKMDFIGYYYFMLTGSPANPTQSALMNATLVALAEHGLTPSVQAARMTLNAGPEAMQGAVAAGILGCGSVVLGSSAQAGLFLASVVQRLKAGGPPPDDLIRSILQEHRDRKMAIPGFGHGQHATHDPRTRRLVAYARELGAAGPHVDALLAIERVIPEVLGRALPANVSGAIPAVLLDCGFPVAALKGIPILARTAGILAHLQEEVSRPIGFLMASAAIDSISYDGVAPAARAVAGSVA